MSSYDFSELILSSYMEGRITTHFKLSDTEIATLKCPDKQPDCFVGTLHEIYITQLHARVHIFKL